MSPKSGRCHNSETSVPWEDMGHGDRYVLTDQPGVGTGVSLL